MQSKKWVTSLKQYEYVVFLSWDRLKCVSTLGEGGCTSVPKLTIKRSTFFPVCRMISYIFFNTNRRFIIFIIALIRVYFFHWHYPILFSFDFTVIFVSFLCIFSFIVNIGEYISFFLVIARRQIFASWWLKKFLHFIAINDIFIRFWLIYFSLRSYFFYISIFTFFADLMLWRLQLNVLQYNYFICAYFFSFISTVVIVIQNCFFRIISIPYI